MTPVLPIALLGIGIAMMCMQLADLYMQLLEARAREEEQEEEPPRRVYTHFDLAATKLEPRKGGSKK